jgi:hypothetical protein
VAACAESMVAARSAKAEAGAVWQLVSSRFGVKQVAARKEAGYKKATGFSFFLFYFPPKCVTHVDGDAAESILTGTAELLRTPFWAHR